MPGRNFIGQPLRTYEKSLNSNNNNIQHRILGVLVCHITLQYSLTAETGSTRYSAGRAWRPLQGMFSIIESPRPYITNHGTQAKCTPARKCSMEDDVFMNEDDEG